LASTLIVRLFFGALPSLEDGLQLAIQRRDLFFDSYGTLQLVDAQVVYIHNASDI
jgi:hypothetical protein